MNPTSTAPAASTSFIVRQADIEVPAAPTASPPPANSNTAVVPNPEELARDSEPFAATAYGAVAIAYLEFRRNIYHEERPLLMTNLPTSPQLPRSELALLAENSLRLMPPAVKSAPILGGLLEHLEQVTELHSLSAAKCLELHNLAMVQLHGTKGGLQAWFVEWALSCAHRLSHVKQDDYFFAFPWDACLYKSASELVVFDDAVRTGDSVEIKRQIAQIGDRLIAALDDPIRAQGQYAFTGEESEWRKMLFHLKTSAALMLAAYLVTDEARALLRPRQVKPALTSVLAPLPAAASTGVEPITSA
jgi:hypothetical protein